MDWLDERMMGVIHESTLFCILEKPYNLYNENGDREFDKTYALKQATTLITMLTSHAFCEGVKIAQEMANQSRISEDRFCLVPEPCAEDVLRVSEEYYIFLYDEKMFISIDRHSFVQKFAKFVSCTSNMLRIDKAELHSLLLRNVVYHHGKNIQTKIMSISAAITRGVNRFDMMIDWLTTMIDFSIDQDVILYLFTDTEVSYNEISNFIIKIQDFIRSNVNVAFGNESDLSLDEAQELVCLVAYEKKKENILKIVY